MDQSASGRRTNVDVLDEDTRARLGDQLSDDGCEQRRTSVYAGGLFAQISPVTPTAHRPGSFLQNKRSSSAASLAELGLMLSDDQSSLMKDGLGARIIGWLGLPRWSHEGASTGTRRSSTPTKSCWAASFRPSSMSTTLRVL
jgi:hypothetical protein